MVFFLSLVYADGILLDDTVSFSRASCVCMCKGGGELSISLHYCFFKTLVIHHLGRHLLQRTENSAFD